MGKFWRSESEQIQEPKFCSNFEQAGPLVTRILNQFLSNFDRFFDRNWFKSGNPKIDGNSNDFRQFFNTNLKPATCSNYRACRQKQGFCPLRIRLTIAIKSWLAFVKKTAVLVEMFANLIDRMSSKFCESKNHRISANVGQFLTECLAKLDQMLYNFETNWNRN